MASWLTSIRVDNSDAGVGTVNQVVDVFFWVDICLAFVTLPSRADRRTSVKQRHTPQAVAREYVLTWFIPDVLAVFPFHAINSGLQYLLLFRVIRILRLVKFMSAERYTRFLQHWEYQTSGSVIPHLITTNVDCLYRSSFNLYQIDMFIQGLCVLPNYS
jgi:hypothetical protein